MSDPAPNRNNWLLPDEYKRLQRIRRRSSPISPVQFFTKLEGVYDQIRDAQSELDRLKHDQCLTAAERAILADQSWQLGRQKTELGELIATVRRRFQR